MGTCNPKGPLLTFQKMVKRPSITCIKLFFQKPIRALLGCTSPNIEIAGALQNDKWGIADRKLPSKKFKNDQFLLIVKGEVFFFLTSPLMGDKPFNGRPYRSSSFLIRKLSGVVARYPIFEIVVPS